MMKVGANASSFVSILGINSFSGNNDTGLPIYSRGEVTLENITADNNKTQDGAYIDNDPASAGNVTITGNNSFSGNGGGDGDEGLHINSRGNVTLENITASNNTGPWRLHQEYFQQQRCNRDDEWCQCYQQQCR